MSLHPIFDAIHENRIEQIKHLVNQDPTCLKKVDSSERTPLLLVCYQKKEMLTTLFLSYPECDVNVQDIGRDTPLIWAISSEMSLKTVRLFIEKGADFNVKDDEELTPLILAAYGGQDDVVRYLIKKGAEIDHKDKEGDSLYSAIQEGRCQIDPEWIIQHGYFLREETKKKFIALRLEKLFE